MKRESIIIERGKEVTLCCDGQRWREVFVDRRKDVC